MELVSTLWVVIAGIIVLDMQAGFLCLESGAVRTKNAANVAIKNLSDVCFVSMVFWVVGFGIMYGPSMGGLFGTGPFMPSLDDEDGRRMAAFFIFQMAFAATAATIVSGAVAERERFEGYIVLSLVTGGLVYPVAGHWIWGGAWDGGTQGWLAQMGYVDLQARPLCIRLAGLRHLRRQLFWGPG